MKIASWNVNSLKVRLPQVLQWLESEKPDIIGLQETKLTDELFPRDEIEAAGYRVLFSGQKTYNGVALLSREEATDPITDLPGLDDPQRRVLGATVSGVRFLNLYVPNGKEVGSDKYAYKLDWIEKLQAHVRAQLEIHENVVIVGDFNIAPEDRDVYDPAGWADSVLFSPPEREAFRRLLVPMLSACSNRKRKSGRGGTTAWARSGATWACASTTSSSRAPSRNPAPPAASTGPPGPGSGRQTTRR